MRFSRTTLKTFRDIRRARWQFLAVCIAAALGVAIFIASYGSFQNLKSSYDRTYDRLLMADYWFDFQSAPQSATAQVKTVPGVQSVDGRLVEDVPVVFPGDSLRILARLVSLPSPGQRATVNNVSVVNGNYVQSDSQVLLEQTFASFNHLKSGDTIQVIPPSGQPVTLTVAGTVVTPEYLFSARNEQEMFTPPSQFGVIFVPYNTLASLVGKDGEINDVAIRLAPGADATTVTSAVNNVLETYGPTRMTDRTHQLSNRLLKLDLDGFKSLALVFPLLFLIVGSLAVYTLLSRLMQSQRGQIGVMRAMGYGRGAILRHYTGFGLLVGLIGSTLGVIVGWLLADLVTHGYASSLDIPYVVVGANWSLIVIGFLAGFGVAVVSALLPAWSAANIPPAEAMKPPAPSRGFRLPLERVVPMMRKLPMGFKLPLRNVSRVPRRTLFTALGIGAGVSLVLVAASLLDSFNSAINLQFDSIQNYQARVDFSSPFPQSSVGEVAAVSGVQAVEPIVEVPVRLSNGSGTSDLLMQGVQPDGNLLRTYASDGRRLQPGNGLLIPETLASTLGLHKGDSVQVQPLVGGGAPVDLPIDAIAEQPMGSVVVTQLSTASSLLGTNSAGTAMLVRLNSGDTSAIEQALYKIDGVSSVQLKKDVRDYVGQFSTLFVAFVSVMLAFGVILGFVVIFNSITISALERQREFATMRVIGISLGRVVQVLTVENVIVGTLGILLGLPIGLLIAHYFASLYQNDLIDMPLVIFTRTYVLAVAGAIVTVLLAEIPAVRFVRRLNLPAVSRELTS